MRRIIPFIGSVFLGLFFTVVSTPASAEGCVPSVKMPKKICVTDSCDMIGMSMLDGDQKNIIACLLDDSGNQVWKALSGSGTTNATETPSGKPAYTCPSIPAQSASGFPSYCWGQSGLQTSCRAPGKDSYGSWEMKDYPCQKN